MEAVVFSPAGEPLYGNESFRYWLETQGLAKETVKNYVVSFSTWCHWTSLYGVDWLSPRKEDVRAYAGYLLARLAPATVQLKVIGLRVYYNFLADSGVYEAQNPASWIDLKKPKPKPVEPFSKDELQRMYAACKTHQERAVYLLLVGGGLRRSEVYGIRRDDVNREARTIRVTGKGNETRWIKPGQSVIDAVLSAMEFSDRLCPQTSNDVVERIVQRLAQRAGIRGRVHPHRFRHNFATSFLDAGGTIEALQHTLGHKHFGMSLQYARANAKARALDAQEAISIAERLLGTA